MEELLQIRELLLDGNNHDALLLVEELTDMSKEDKLNKVFSFSVILLLHLIKRSAEKRTTRSWDNSIFNAVKQIQRTNKRRSSGGYYLTHSELQETLEDAYQLALNQGAIEIFEGKYEADEIANMVERFEIIKQGMELILASDR